MCAKSSIKEQAPLPNCMTVPVHALALCAKSFILFLEQSEPKPVAAVGNVNGPRALHTVCSSTRGLRHKSGRVQLAKVCLASLFAGATLLQRQRALGRGCVAVSD